MTNSAARAHGDHRSVVIRGPSDHPRHRIVVHDYAGHAFPVDLARELARRGNQVLHVYFSNAETPQGPMEPRPDDAPGLEISAVRIAGRFQKHAYFLRRRQELEYARLVALKIAAFVPDVVVSANAPLEVQRVLFKASKAQGSRTVFWAQDLYSLAVLRLLPRKLPILGRVIGYYYVLMERQLMRSADAVVLIAADFERIMWHWGVARERFHVIANWAIKDEIVPTEKSNSWARSHGLADRKVLLYSGTLGMKHNPELLLELAQSLKKRDDAVVVVVSEGPGATYLANKVSELGLKNLFLYPFQPHRRLSDVLGSADVLLAVLEPEASAFSVPSKVWCYMCAGRSLLLAVPAENLAARAVQEAGAGFVVNPNDPASFVAKAASLLEDDQLRCHLGLNSRRYAEKNFDVKKIASRFEAVWA